MKILFLFSSRRLLRNGEKGKKNKKKKKEKKKEKKKKKKKRKKEKSLLLWLAPALVPAGLPLCGGVFRNSPLPIPDVGSKPNGKDSS